MYVDYVARHVWDGEVKFICIYSLKQMCYDIQTFYDNLFFYSIVML